MLLMAGVLTSRVVYAMQSSDVPMTPLDRSLQGGSLAWHNHKQATPCGRKGNDDSRIKL